MIASNLVGNLFQKYPHLIPAYVSKWEKSDNMWLVRTAIIFQLKYKNDTDFKLLKRVIERHLSSKEFFIQKAIGWALRQYAKFEPELVQEYVKRTDLKPLSRREALKHFKKRPLKKDKKDLLGIIWNFQHLLTIQIRR